MRRRLARLEEIYGDTAAVWQLFDECFSLLGISSGISLRRAGFDISACAEALEWLPQYAAYRRVHPVSDYWNPDDPLYDLPFAQPESPGTEAALTTFLCVPFGMAVEQLDTSRNRESKRHLIAFFDTLRSGIELAISESARTLAALIPSPESGPKSIASKVTDLILFLGLISLREFGRQRGWIAGQFQISSDGLNQAMDRYDESKIEKNVVGGAFRALDDKRRLVRR